MEIWKSLNGIVELGENYEISNYGNIRNLNNLKLRKLQYDKDGYYIIKLYSGDIGKNYRVHRLVAMVFIDKVENKEIINHKDGNKTNNKASKILNG